MATTGVMNGTKFRLYVDQAGGSTYTAIGNSTDVTINAQHSARETTNQDSAGFADFLEGKRSYTIDFNALYAEEGTNDFELFHATFISQTLRAKVTFKLATVTSGDSTLTGTGYLTSLVKNSGGVESNVTFSGSIQVTGQLTAGTVSP
jgi:predicted secreted protein